MPPTAVLNKLKRELEDVYEIDVPVDLHDFVFTDVETAQSLSSQRSVSPRENLFVASDGDTAAISLFIDETIVDELHTDDPTVALHDGNLPAFCVAMEGISHFTYVAWRAHHDRQVSQLELEMQAEVDKFVTVARIMSRQAEGRVPEGLGQRLFEQVSFRADLDADSRERYETANAYAGRYCRELERRLMERSDGQSMTRELRRFYRLDQHQKIRHIDAG